MTTFFIIGDPHFKTGALLENNAMVEAIYRQIEIIKPDILVCLGDTLDTHESIHVSPLTRAVDFLIKLSKYAPTYCLIGNHDLRNNKQYFSEEHPFTGLKHLPNLTIVDKTHLASINGQDYVFVPYVPPGRFIEALDSLKSPINAWKQATCIFAHQEFRGCKTGVQVSQEGDVWDHVNPLVISGHIHEYSQLQHNLIYAGTPIQQDFSASPDKAIMIVKFHPRDEYNGTSSKEFSRVSLNLPVKLTVTVECRNVSEYVPPNNYKLKIKLVGTPGELRTAMKHPNVEAWKKRGYKIVTFQMANSNLDADASQSHYANQSMQPVIRKKFSESLKEQISSDSALVDLYNQLFDNVKHPILNIMQ